ncbi:ankyrin [Eremomyces bilateralis CBS 781.70]|uniref:Ankyrin n=1 Tax=Eremomyces bilateralis CBS 781.70 TaxID=1392243 RepID=A0A6G1FW25_9PEZI|nr:ankyrin [Eremomyces bilateralis CBS 781.70]KAF1809928.1 ankyrin [Eremomyces bilateralis CBS 781.70]
MVLPLIESTRLSLSLFPFQGQEADKAERLQKEMNACLGSLCFGDIHARRQDIAAAHPNTCDWLFTTTEYKKWWDRTDLQSHNGVLWIKGKPGAGKSTLMKHTLGHLEKTSVNNLVIAYFFNARGGIFEKTPLGMLRSIVHQLVDKEAMLYENFASIFRERQRIHTGDWEWRQSELKEFILSEIRQWKSKPLVLLVDALDECNEVDVWDVVGFLELLSIYAVRFGAPLRICLSSRHYPSVRVKRSLELTVEKSENHQEDIARYIKERLTKEDDDDIEDLEDIEDEIGRRANGIFMWVAIVVSLLNKAYYEGRMEVMRKTLEEVPNDLEEVFDNLLRKDGGNKAETILMLQWVLLCQRLLKPEELFIAVMTGIPPKRIDRWNRSKFSRDIIQRRITSSSKGLIEVRKLRGASVQFIHLSVNDSLLRNQMLQKLDQTLGPESISASHGRLWACCWSYIERVDTTVLYILADDANVNAQGGYYGTALQAAMYGSKKELVELLLTQGADVNAKGGNYGTQLQAAAYGGKKELVELLLGQGAGVNAQGGHYGAALQAAAAAYRVNKELVELLLAQGADINAQGGYHGTALQEATYRINTKGVELLLAQGAK